MKLRFDSQTPGDNEEFKVSHATVLDCHFRHLSLDWQRGWILIPGHKTLRVKEVYRESRVTILSRCKVRFRF